MSDDPWVPMDNCVHTVAAMLQYDIRGAYDTLSDAVGGGKIRFQWNGKPATIDQLVTRGEAAREGGRWQLPHRLDLHRVSFLKWLEPQRPKVISGAKRGRKASYDWEAAWAFMLKVFHDDGGFPKRQSNMERRLVEWFSTNFDSEPQSSEIKLRVAAAYRAIGR